ncbi:MAG: mechanosensitive ion channel family protein [Tannerellaceae bacterium]|jgi:miniconductance mechanosensitive channel|nr:mechanosensitive ion channel family protein [Tannerellaceae bacterium]
MEFVREWVNKYLTSWGLIEKSADTSAHIIVLLCILILVYVVDYMMRVVVLGIFRRMAARTKNEFDDLIVDRKIIHKLIHILPAFLIYILLPLAFPVQEQSQTLDFVQRLCIIYMIASVLRFIHALLNLIHDFFNRKESFKNKPIKGFVQIIQITSYFVGGILIIAVLINRSAVNLFAGLGASAAILILIFKDAILSFVAGIQLSANDMLRAGDWITMPKYHANGVVMEVNLAALKVRNFDNTIVTIPPYALLSESFQNWRGMSESEGRRVKRSISIDMHSVTFCTEEMLNKFRRISLISDYINSKEEELRQYNAAQSIDDSVWVNGRRQTNIGVFRAYLIRYLASHPAINKELPCFARQLQPTDKGIPIELYFFTAEKEWIAYEGIQSDVFDHLLAVIPEFGLRIFQDVSGDDVRNSFPYFTKTGIRN